MEEPTPTLFYADGTYEIWECHTGSKPVGHGYTAQEALAEWKALSESPTAATAGERA